MMAEIITAIGTLASIGGALSSWYHAANAKKFADRAERQIARGRRLSDLAKLETLWDATYTALEMFGQRASSSNLHGRTPTKAARKVQDWVKEVVRCGSSLQGIVDLDQRIENIKVLLADFAEARSGQDLKSKGSDLLSKLSDLDAAIRALRVVDHEKVDLGQ